METPDTSTDSGDGTPTKRGWLSKRKIHMLAFGVRTIFGFLLAVFCCGSLVYLMLNGGECSTFTSMYFSLLSFVAGYFLAKSPSLKAKAQTIRNMASPSEMVKDMTMHPMSPPSPIHHEHEGDDNAL